MAISLRRSRRATKKGVSEYNVGDIVEIDRQHGVIARGRLAQLLTEGPSPNPRWLVKFDSQPYKDEEMYERAFGKLLYSVEEGEEQHSTVSSPEPAGSGSARGKTDPASDGKGQGASSEGEKSDDGKKGRSGIETAAPAPTSSRTRSTQFHRAGGTFSQDSADDSSPAEEASRSRASAREARSRRRQAMIDDLAIVPGTEILAGKRKLPPPPGNRSKQYKNNESQYSEEGEVVKVKLLTGTLYLYRGEQRRVEFVRRV
mmetsp:Transcript_25123/g.69300  ORF Transcript_25123/g.69300 Transcript_25123/m.69300 type:complete len:258 (-) Transcript_25123:339-1112(-)|eukprot:CAMPEP_0172362060 /NCGR_PEP_ID=MMETSP1060-20121228/5760_1 /TAXON_ID=37318 /ORGANISM="Pseudo-nitzschia pungens, Strain cf. cingulata" /LENGTH=257 /DNA_ID=CAMNT_0013084479 /DNA_START=81 /DNA_END=854 /DNA_ORIENTATION=+